MHDKIGNALKLSHNTHTKIRKLNNKIHNNTLIVIIVWGKKSVIVISRILHFEQDVQHEFCWTTCCLTKLSQIYLYSTREQGKKVLLLLLLLLLKGNNNKNTVPE